MTAISPAKIRLTECALQMFAERGYAATSMRDIAGKLGIQAPSIYSHVPGKQALLQACVAPYLQELGRLVADPPGSWDELLASYMETVFRHPAAARVMHLDQSVEVVELGRSVKIRLSYLLGELGVPDGLAAPLLAMARQPWMQEPSPDADSLAVFRVINHLAADREPWT